VQAFGAVAPTEALDVELGAAGVDLEREEVLPLGARGVQLGDLSARGPERHEGVVVDRHLPEERGHLTVHARELLAQIPAREVDEVDALVDELAAPRDRRIGAPLLLVTDAPTVAVARTNEHDRPADPRVEDLARLEAAGWKRWLKPTCTVTFELDARATRGRVA